MARLSIALSAALLLLFTAGCDEWPGLSGEGDAGAGSGAGTRVDDTSGLLGSGCANGRAVCTQGLSCVESLPGGLCTRDCQSDADCNGGVCVPSAQGLLCFKGCATDLTCRPGYDCISTGEKGVCLPSQSSGALDAGAD